MKIFGHNGCLTGIFSRKPEVEPIFVNASPITNALTSYILTSLSLTVQKSPFRTILWFLLFGMWEWKSGGMKCDPYILRFDLYNTTIDAFCLFVLLFKYKYFRTHLMPFVQHLCHRYTIQNFTSLTYLEALWLIQFVSQNHCTRWILVRLRNRSGDRIHALWKLPTYLSKTTSANIRWQQWQNGGLRCNDTAAILCLLWSLSARMWSVLPVWVWYEYVVDFVLYHVVWLTFYCLFVCFRFTLDEKKASWYLLVRVFLCIFWGHE